ncbi:DUF2663 family protein [Paenibacillus lycopersici]|uniref:DUF2663 family protein n=1 Tax=Paenibacillus lycopersici TaxID=2704462 RepID=A0A6C0G4R1_9BACL|nr:DUF2663 family protein [Paenibacillus lycopersici]QHT61830.1 DUF2663 family protein [Paenibacillus lycopersici]
MPWQDHVSADVVSTIKKLKDRKKTLNRFKASYTVFTMFTYALSLLLLFSIYQQLSRIGNKSNLMEFVGTIAGNRSFLLVFVLSICGHTYQRYLKGQYETAKKKYEALRHETIDWMQTTWWKSMSSDLKDEISDEMNGDDINISYKN